MNTKLLTTAAVLAFGVSFGAQASLTSSGPLTVYDSEQNLTWTQDANLNGQMDWATAVAWADGLDYASYSDWVLPTIAQLTTQFSTNFAQPQGTPISVAHNGSYDLFKNVQDSPYWSISAHSNPNKAWAFGADDGSQHVLSKSFPISAWAVRTGGAVAAAPAAVPLPAATWLFLSGLMGVAGLKRRKNIG